MLKPPQANGRRTSKSQKETEVVEASQRIERAKKMESVSGFRKSNKMRHYLVNEPEVGTFAHKRWLVAHVMNHSSIKGFLVVCIIGNAVTIGLEADYGDDSAMWFAIETSFLVIFTTELTLNLFAFGGMFWEDRWNWMDAGMCFAQRPHACLKCPSGGTCRHGSPHHDSDPNHNNRYHWYVDS